MDASQASGARSGSRSCCRSSRAASGPGLELQERRRSQALAQDGLGGIGYLLITFFLYPVTMFLMANEVEKAYREAGREPAITTLWGLWFLLPIIGLFVWYIKIQSALNDLWTMHGQTNDPGL